MIQMIPWAYNLIRQRHPAVGLTPDFVVGMRNHANALQAMLLYMQDTWNDLAANEDVQYALSAKLATQTELLAAGDGLADAERDPRGGPAEAPGRSDRRSDPLRTIVGDSSTESRRSTCASSHPLVEALVDEELAPGGGAVGCRPSPLSIPSSERKKKLVCGLISSSAWPSRVRAGRSRCRSSRAARGVGGAAAGARRRRRRAGRARRARYRRRCSFGERQGHPRLEPGEHARMNVGMSGEIIVQPVRPGIHQRAQPAPAAAIMALSPPDRSKPLPQILPRALPLGLGGSARAPSMNPCRCGEPFLGLGVDRAEHGVGIADAADMGDAPIVASNGHPRGLGLPPRSARERRIGPPPAPTSATAAGRSRRGQSSSSWPSGIGTWWARQDLNLAT